MAAQLQAYTLITKPGQTIELYATGPDDWVEIILRLETAGPVAVGPNKNLIPATSGAGVLLIPGKDKAFKIPPATTFNYASDSVNRIGIVVQPYPWLEQILLTLGKLAGGVVSTVSKLVASVSPKKKG